MFYLPRFLLPGLATPKSILTTCLTVLALAPSLVAQDRTWDINGDGNYDTAANWDPIDVPDTSTENAIITSSDGTAVTVTLGPSLTRDVGNFTIQDNGANPDHELFIGNNTFFDVHGDIFNDGIISLNSLGNSTQLRLDGSNLTLNGSGVMQLGANANNGIGNASGANTLFNTTNHSIIGGGNIGLSSIGINNAGTINANLTGVVMTIDPSVLGATNTGTMQATNSGILSLTGSGGGTFTNTGGVIEADGAASEVRLTSSATVIGGTVRGTGGGLVSVTASQNAFFSDVTFEGDILANNNSDFGISGTITNNGTITLASLGNNTDLEVQAGGATLAGTGRVVLSNNVTAGINGVSNEVLTNSATHTIEGQGSFGENAIGIVNQGTINANVSGAILTIDPDSVTGFVNSGIARATGGGILSLTGSGGGTFTNTGAVIEADGAASEVQLTADATVIGGTVRATGGGLVRVNTSQSVFFSDVTFEGDILANDNSDFGISGTITNNGTITLESLGNNTDLEVQAGGATLSGPGRVVLSNSVNAGINGGATDVLTNSANHTIEGQGSFGEDTIGIDNQGTINANVSGATLTIDPGSANNFVNSGIARASGGGILTLTGSGGGTFTNTDAVIEADGAASEVQLIADATVIGGTVRATGGGLVRVNTSQSVFFSDVIFEGDVQANDNSDFGISGTITNNGTITLASLGNNTDLEVQAGGATLAGTGRVVLSNSVNAGINGGATDVLTNSATHTIEGQGSFGEDTIGIDNQGTINANVSGATLTIDPDSVNNFINSGVARATGGGILSLTGAGGGTFTNTGAVIEADGAASEVRLTADATVIGGTVRATGGGLVRVNTSQNAFFSDVTFEGDILANNNSDFGISGTITNNGTITLDSLGNNTDLEVQAGGATLAGTGRVVLSNNVNAGINGVSTDVLTNSATHTIEGQGSFGENTIGVDNQGTINANVSGATLTIDPDSVNNFVNSGIARASGGGILSLTGSGGGTFTNNGTFEALDDSSFNTVGGATLTNLSAGTLTGGTYRAVDGGNGASVAILGTAVDTIANGTTTVELSGAGATMTYGGTALQDSLVTQNGTLRIFDGHQFNMANALNNNGTTELGGAGLGGGQLTSTGDITNTSGAEIFGHGTINNTILNSGTVRAANGSLAIVGGVIDGQSGTIQVDSGASLNLSGASGDSDADFLTHNGTDLNLGNNNVLVREDYTNANFGTGNSFNHRANVTGTGQILADSAVTQTLSGDVSNGGTATPSIVFGNLRVGDSATQNYTVDNAGTGPAIRGALQTDGSAGNGGNVTDSRLSGSGVTAANFDAVSTGSSSTNQEVTFNASSAGALTGQQVAVVNNFDNVDNQTLQISGAAYNAAEASITPTPINFGEFHVGDAATLQSLTLANNAVAGSFSEDLLVDNFGSTGDAQLTAPVSVNLIAGASDNTSVSVGIDTTAAGAKSGTVTADQSSTATVNGSAIFGLSALDLGQGSVSVSAEVFQLANSAPVSPSPVDFGIVHVGDTVSQAIDIANNAVAGSFTEFLDASVSSMTGDASATGGVNNLVAGSGIDNSISVSIDTSVAGSRSGMVGLDFASDPNGINSLGMTSLGSETIDVLATVNEFADPTVTLLFGIVTLSQISQDEYALDFGSLMQGDPLATAELGVLNDVIGQADVLSGSFVTSGDAAFGFSGFDSFADLVAGDTLGNLDLTFNTSSLGNFTGQILFDPLSENVSGFSGSLNQVTVNLTGSVVSVIPEPGSTVVLLCAGLYVLGLRRRKNA